MFRPGPLVRHLCAALFACTVFAMHSATADTVSIDIIPQDELLDYLAKGEVFTLVDARSPAEFEAGHVHGAINLPHDSEIAPDILPETRDAGIVVYCKSGRRAWQLKQRLDALGYSDVRVLAPSQMMWADELPVFNCANQPQKAFELDLALDQ